MNQNQSTTLICDFPISTGSLHDNYRSIMNSVKRGEGMWVVTLNLQMIYRARSQRGYRELLNKADLFIADGVPLIWASKVKAGAPEIAGRSNGTDLVKKLLTSDAGFRLGVIGGHQPERVVQKLNAGLLDDAYFYDGAVDMDDTDTVSKLIGDLKRANTNLLLLGLGVPKQDELAWKIRQHAKEITVIGVGGAFDLLSGEKVRAPAWMQKNGLEWLHRLVSEPRRLAKRYLINYPQALFALVKDLIKK